MSAQPAHEPTPRSPYRLSAAEGPQTLPELRAALAAVSPADLVAFNTALDAVRLDEVSKLLTEYRHVWALRTRSEVTAAIGASLAGTATLQSGRDLFAAYGLTDEAGAA
ncbi:hypothetical protein [Streptomyces fildesensis]|uniref:hypothetical protein n=1 Tax=Streptomyces fildesensis TaxID=375757 RepID=UPI0018DFE69E|nr:hypothetical protein [Streptomyces fildesensis]